MTAGRMLLRTMKHINSRTFLLLLVVLSTVIETTGTASSDSGQPAVPLVRVPPPHTPCNGSGKGVSEEVKVEFSSSVIENGKS